MQKHTSKNANAVTSAIAALVAVYNTAMQAVLANSNLQTNAALANAANNLLANVQYVQTCNAAQALLLHVQALVSTSTRTSNLKLYANLYAASATSVQYYYAAIAVFAQRMQYSTTFAQKRANIYYNIARKKAQAQLRASAATQAQAS